MEDSRLKPFGKFAGSWSGSGKGPQGPFDVRAVFEERGRWILLRHQITPPGSTEPFYLSTQVFGYDEEGLTLDYFDTAGSFRFRGKEVQEGLVFSWKADNLKSDDLRKTSKYGFDETGKISFVYQSLERQEDESEACIEFTGEIIKAND